MELNQIEAFVSVATLGGFTKASRQLHRTQPAVSRRVQLLEKSLGVNLFERRGREVTLTPQGYAFLQYAQIALAAIRDGKRAVNETVDADAGGPPIGLAIVGTLADRQLTMALSKFRQQYPTTDVILRTATSREVSMLVRRGEAEIGIRYYSDDHPELETTELGDEKLFLVVSAIHRLSDRIIGGPRDLEGENFMGFPFDATRSDSLGGLLPRELHAYGLADPKITHIDSLTAQKRLVESGYGIALLPLSACHEEIDRGVLSILKFKGSAIEAVEPVVAVQRKTGVRRKRVTELLALIESSFDLTK